MLYAKDRQLCDKKRFRETIRKETTRTGSTEANISSAKSARAHRLEVTTRAGTWVEAARRIANACDRGDMVQLPPVYAALHISSCLAVTAQMHECLEQSAWATCQSGTSLRSFASV